MAAREKLLGGVEEWREKGEATNAEAKALRASAANKRHNVTGFSFSASAAPAATVAVVISQTAGTVERRKFHVPANAFLPYVYEFKYVLEVPYGEDVQIAMPALGAGVVGCVELVGFTESA
jgi:hypothetical protein